jgi:hypothetical protein
MQIFRLPSFAEKFLVAAVTLISLTACSPKFDWREINVDTFHYAIALPGKPATVTRDIDLSGVKVSMTMTATEVGSTTFAVGTAELPTATQAQLSLSTMKTAMVRNIDGTIKQEKVLTMPASAQAESGKLAVTEVEATGQASAATSNQPRVLFARFIAKDKRVYQLVATGPAKQLSRDVVDTFFSSFKLN